MYRFAALLLASGLLAVGCVGGPSSTSTAEPSSLPTAPAGSPTPLVTIAATPTAPPPLVGVWAGVHNCQRIFDVLTGTGMPEQALLNIVDAGVLPGVNSVDDIADPAHPCAGAVDVRHSHFFLASGAFGSRDASGQQVDDGFWSIVDATTLAIGDAEFHYEIEGNQLRMEPLNVGPCPTDGEWCPEAWKLMVAMPGLAWTRT